MEFIYFKKKQINGNVIHKANKLQVNFMSTALAASGAEDGTMGLSSVPAEQAH